MQRSMVWAWLCWAWVLPASAAEPEFAPVAIRVPEGYEVSLAAAPPLVAHPLMAGFDDRGRLYVAENAGLNLPRKELEAQLPNSVIRLEDSDGDGVFDKRTVFADKLVFPQGALWHRGSVYVASPPSIWKFTDTDDDGVADVREEIVNKFGYIGNAADIHGCFLGPDGRVYWCDGRHGHELRDAEGRVTSSGKAARIFSCRADGSDVQVHCGGGMDNPVEIDFLPTGEMLGTVNLMYLQRGDCLVHWLRGGVYPREDQQACIDEFPYTGGLLGPVVDYGHVAVSGTTRYRSSALDATFQDNFFVTQFNSHKVVRTALVPDGSTYRAEVHDFLQGASDDFHPTDVLEDADGSLLVIDTGGWFRIGCPTSQIAKPNILGAIYRIRRKDAPRIDDPRGQKLSWTDARHADLVQRLADGRFAVRDRAIDTLAARGDEALPEIEALLARADDERAKLAAVWALTRIASPAAQQAVRSAMADKHSSVRLAAITSAGRTADTKAFQPLVEALQSELPAERRAAATALGALKQAKAIGPLLAALALDTDRSLEHAITFACIEIGATEPLLAALKDPHPAVRRVALIALDQSPRQPLEQAHVTGLLTASDPALLQEVVRIAAKHPDWAAGFHALIATLLAKAEPTDADQALLAGAIAAFGRQPTVQQALSEALQRKDLADSSRRVVLNALAVLDVQAVPQAWIEGVRAALASTDSDTVSAAIAASSNLGRDPFVAALQSLARDTAHSPALRVQALDVLVKPSIRLGEEDFAFLLARQRNAEKPLARLAAARVLGKIRPTSTQWPAVQETLASAGPLEIASLAGVLEHCDEEQPFRATLEVLAKNQHAANLDPSLIVAWSQRFGLQTQELARKLAERFQTQDTAVRAELDRLEAAFDRAGDAGRGGAVFFGRSGCAACHRIGSQGGRIGPDLSTIGARRSTRDLVEAIIAPSASQARGFESFVVETADGRVRSGVIARETAQYVTLRQADQTLHEIARRDIETLSPARVSLMPGGLERSLSQEQFADLVAFLRSLK